MTEKEVLVLAKQLVNEHIPDKTVLVGLSGTKKSLGDARYFPPRIRISKHWIPLLPREEIVDTILHEIAHIIAGPGAGHGPAWKRACRQVGANPERLAAVDASPKHSIHGHCPTCNKTVGRWYRMPRNTYIHSTCRTELEYRRVS